jgi:hypothetical protein
MTLQVGGVSKIKSIKYAQFKTTDPTFRQRRLPTSSKIKSRKKEKLIADPKGVPYSVKSLTNSLYY